MKASLRCTYASSLVWLGVLLFGVTLWQSSCGVTPRSYDREGLLGDLGRHVIVPGYQELERALKAFEQSSSVFCDAPHKDSLVALRLAWQSARSALKRTEAWRTGPFAT